MQQVTVLSLNTQLFSEFRTLNYYKVILSEKITICNVLMQNNNKKKGDLHLNHSYDLHKQWLDCRFYSLNKPESQD